jgi:tetratricopeptide (TPR) repeat protein
VAASSSAADKLEIQKDFHTAQQAMADGLYNVAAVKAGRLLQEGKWSADDQQRLASLWVESLVRSGQGDAALEVLKAYTIANHDYWEGQALILTGEFSDASAILTEAISKASDELRPWAIIARAHALVGEGRDASARTMLTPLREHRDPTIAKHARLFFNELEASTRTQTVLNRLARERGPKDASIQYLRARALMEQGNLKTSESVLRDLLHTDSSGMKRVVHDAAVVLLADVLWRQRSAEASTQLLSFINSFNTTTDGRSDSEFWDEAFAQLERIALASKPSETFLNPAIAWASDDTMPERQGYALMFLTSELHRSGRDVEATGLVESLLQRHPRHPCASDAIRLAMQLHGIARNDSRVLQLAERWQKDFGENSGKGVVDFLVGLIHFMRGDYRDALKSFTLAADGEADMARRRRALYNAALCAIQTGQKTVLQSLITQLAEASVEDPNRKPNAPPITDTAADLALDKALQLASKLDPKAEKELNEFINQHPTNARLAEAHVALAEFRMLDVPPRVKEAIESLDLATQLASSPSLKERIAYVRVWLREAQMDLAGVVREAQAFLIAWPESSRSDEIHMKLAESFYRQEKYALARTEFERLASTQPTSTYADAALYFAGMSAMAVPTVEGLNAAISTWDDLIQRNGPLTFAARLQQAVATRRQGNPEKALKIYDALLELPEAKGEQRLSLQLDKAELLIDMGKKEPARFDEAVTLLRVILATPQLPNAWSGRCGVLLAATLRDLQRPDEALEACYDVVNIGTNVLTGPQNPTEYLWFYRAGFIAVDLLESEQQWEAAARMAERLSKTSGDRAKDAAERASKIRLKHFLWDGEK